jgi:two-component system chemotaxis response regulator CheY
MGTRRALIIEDCMVTVSALSSILSDLGFDVEAAYSAEDAQKLLSENSAWNVILIDWLLPGMPGTELVQHIRSGPFSKVPIMMVTGQNEIHQVAEALEAGASEYVMKPFTRSIIAEKLLLLGFNEPT